MEPILITKDVWLNSQLSIARYYGGCQAFGHRYLIVGEKNDLVREDLVSLYNKVGRKKFLEMIDLIDWHCAEADKIFKNMVKELTAKKKEKEKEPLTINFNEK